mgnify:CR=1 FL=1
MTSQSLSEHSKTHELHEPSFLGAMQGWMLGKLRPRLTVRSVSFRIIPAKLHNQLALEACWSSKSTN